MLHYAAQRNDVALLTTLLSCVRERYPQAVKEELRAYLVDACLQHLVNVNTPAQDDPDIVLIPPTLPTAPDEGSRSCNSSSAAKLSMGSFPSLSTSCNSTSSSTRYHSSSSTTAALDSIAASLPLTSEEPTSLASLSRFQNNTARTINSWAKNMVLSGALFGGNGFSKFKPSLFEAKDRFTSQFPFSAATRGFNTRISDALCLQNASEWTPFRTAAHFGSLHCMAVLLANGAGNLVQLKDIPLLRTIKGRSLQSSRGNGASKPGAGGTSSTNARSMYRRRGVLRRKKEHEGDDAEATIAGAAANASPTSSAAQKIASRMSQGIKKTVGKVRTQDLVGDDCIADWVDSHSYLDDIPNLPNKGGVAIVPGGAEALVLVHGSPLAIEYMARVWEYMARRATSNLMAPHSEQNESPLADLHKDVLDNVMTSESIVQKADNDEDEVEGASLLRQRRLPPLDVLLAIADAVVLNSFTHNCAIEKDTHMTAAEALRSTLPVHHPLTQRLGCPMRRLIEPATWQAYIDTPVPSTGHEGIRSMAFSIGLNHSTAVGGDQSSDSLPAYVSRSVGPYAVPRNRKEGGGEGSLDRKGPGDAGIIPVTFHPALTFEQEYCFSQPLKDREEHVEKVDKDEDIGVKDAMPDSSGGNLNVKQSNRILAQFFPAQMDDPVLRRWVQEDDKTMEEKSVNRQKERNTNIASTYPSVVPSVDAPASEQYVGKKPEENRYRSSDKNDSIAESVTADSDEVFNRRGRSDSRTRIGTYHLPEEVLSPGALNATASASALKPSLDSKHLEEGQRKAQAETVAVEMESAPFSKTYEVTASIPSHWSVTRQERVTRILHCALPAQSFTSHYTTSKPDVNDILNIQYPANLFLPVPDAPFFLPPAPEAAKDEYLPGTFSYLHLAAAIGDAKAIQGFLGRWEYNCYADGNVQGVADTGVETRDYITSDVVTPLPSSSLSATLSGSLSGTLLHNAITRNESLHGTSKRSGMDTLSSTGARNFLSSILAEEAASLGSSDSNLREARSGLPLTEVSESVESGFSNADATDATDEENDAHGRSLGSASLRNTFGREMDPVPGGLDSTLCLSLPANALTMTQPLSSLVDLSVPLSSEEETLEEIEARQTRFVNTWHAGGMDPDIRSNMGAFFSPQRSRRLTHTVPGGLDATLFTVLPASPDGAVHGGIAPATGAAAMLEGGTTLGFAEDDALNSSPTIALDGVSGIAPSETYQRPSHALGTVPRVLSPDLEEEEEAVRAVESDTDPKSVHSEREVPTQAVPGEVPHTPARSYPSLTLHPVPSVNCPGIAGVTPLHLAAGVFRYHASAAETRSSSGSHSFESAFDILLDRMTLSVASSTAGAGSPPTSPTVFTSATSATSTTNPSGIVDAAGRTPLSVLSRGLWERVPGEKLASDVAPGVSVLEFHRLLRWFCAITGAIKGHAPWRPVFRPKQPVDTDNTEDTDRIGLRCVMFGSTRPSSLDNWAVSISTDYNGQNDHIAGKFSMPSALQPSVLCFFSLIPKYRTMLQTLEPSSALNADYSSAPINPDRTMHLIHSGLLEAATYGSFGATLALLHCVQFLLLATANEDRDTLSPAPQSRSLPLLFRAYPTPLHMAVLHANTRLLQPLMRWAYWETIERQKSTLGGSTNVIDYAHKFQCPCLCGYGEMGASHMACYGCRGSLPKMLSISERKQLLEEHVDSSGWTLLHYVASAPARDTLFELLREPEEAEESTAMFRLSPELCPLIFRKHRFASSTPFEELLATSDDSLAVQMLAHIHAATTHNSASTATSRLSSSIRLSGHYAAYTVDSAKKGLFTMEGWQACTTTSKNSFTTPTGDHGKWPCKVQQVEEREQQSGTTPFRVYNQFPVRPYQPIQKGVSTINTSGAALADEEKDEGQPVQGLLFVSHDAGVVVSARSRSSSPGMASSSKHGAVPSTVPPPSIGRLMAFLPSRALLGVVPCLPSGSPPVYIGAWEKDRGAPSDAGNGNDSSSETTVVWNERHNEVLAAAKFGCTTTLLLFLALGVPYSSSNNTSGTNATSAITLYSPSGPNAYLPRRMNLALHASAAGRVETVQALYRMGWDCNTPDANSDTPLHWAAFRGWAATVAVLISASVDERMVKNYADGMKRVQEMAFVEKQKDGLKGHKAANGARVGGGREQVDAFGNSTVPSGGIGSTTSKHSASNPSHSTSKPGTGSNTPLRPSRRRAASRGLSAPGALGSVLHPFPVPPPPFQTRYPAWLRSRFALPPSDPVHLHPVNSDGGLPLHSAANQGSVAVGYLLLTHTPHLTVPPHAASTTASNGAAAGAASATTTTATPNNPAHASEYSNRLSTTACTGSSLGSDATSDRTNVGHAVLLPQCTKGYNHTLYRMLYGEKYQIPWKIAPNATSSLSTNTNDASGPATQSDPAAVGAEYQVPHPHRAPATPRTQWNRRALSSALSNIDVSAGDLDAKICDAPADSSENNSLSQPEQEYAIREWTWHATVADSGITAGPVLVTTGNPSAQHATAGTSTTSTTSGAPSTTTTTATNASAADSQNTFVEYLCSSRAPMWDRNTPLHNSCFEGHAAFSRLLLLFGADPNVKNAEHRSPLLEAAYNGYDKVIHSLLQPYQSNGTNNLNGSKLFPPLMFPFFDGPHTGSFTASDFARPGLFWSSSIRSLLAHRGESMPSTSPATTGVTSTAAADRWLLHPLLRSSTSSMTLVSKTLGAVSTLIFGSTYRPSIPATEDAHSTASALTGARTVAKAPVGDEVASVEKRSQRMESRQVLPTSNSNPFASNVPSPAASPPASASASPSPALSPRPDTVSAPDNAPAVAAESRNPISRARNILKQLLPGNSLSSSPSSSAPASPSAFSNNLAPTTSSGFLVTTPASATASVTASVTAPVTSTPPSPPDTIGSLCKSLLDSETKDVSMFTSSGPSLLPLATLFRFLSIWREHHLSEWSANLPSPCDPDIQDREEDTPLHWAACQGRIRCLLALLRGGACPVTPNVDGGNALHSSVVNNSPLCLLLLVKYGNVPPDTRMLDYHSPDTLRALHGSGTGTGTGAGRGVPHTPRTPVRNHSQVPPSPAAPRTMTTTNTRTPFAGGNITATTAIAAPAITPLGDTSLHIAVGSGRITCARVLLRLGADPNAFDKRGNTALHFAATATAPTPTPAISSGSCPSSLTAHLSAGKTLFPLLLATGGDPSRRNTEGRTPMELLLPEIDTPALALALPVSLLTKLQAEQRSLDQSGILTLEAVADAGTSTRPAVVKHLSESVAIAPSTEDMTDRYPSAASVHPHLLPSEPEKPLAFWRGAGAPAAGTNGSSAGSGTGSSSSSTSVTGAPGTLPREKEEILPSIPLLSHTALVFLSHRFLAHTHTRFVHGLPLSRDALLANISSSTGLQAGATNTISTTWRKDNDTASSFENHSIVPTVQGLELSPLPPVQGYNEVLQALYTWWLALRTKTASQANHPLHHTIPLLFPHLASLPLLLPPSLPASGFQDMAAGVVALRTRCITPLALPLHLAVLDPHPLARARVLACLPPALHPLLPHLLQTALPNTTAGSSFGSTTTPSLSNSSAPVHLPVFGTTVDVRVATRDPPARQPPLPDLPLALLQTAAAPWDVSAALPFLRHSLAAGYGSSYGHGYGYGSNAGAVLSPPFDLLLLTADDFLVQVSTPLLHRSGALIHLWINTQTPIPVPSNLIRKALGNFTGKLEDNDEKVPISPIKLALNVLLPLLAFLYSGDLPSPYAPDTVYDPFLPHILGKLTSISSEKGSQDTPHNATTHTTLDKVPLSLSPPGALESLSLLAWSDAFFAPQLAMRALSNVVLGLTPEVLPDVFDWAVNVCLSNSTPTSEPDSSLSKAFADGTYFEDEEANKSTFSEWLATNCPSIHPAYQASVTPSVTNQKEPTPNPIDFTEYLNWMQHFPVASDSTTADGTMQQQSVGSSSPNSGLPETTPPARQLHTKDKIAASLPPPPPETLPPHHIHSIAWELVLACVSYVCQPEFWDTVCTSLDDMFPASNTNTFVAEKSNTLNDSSTLLALYTNVESTPSTHLPSIHSSIDATSLPSASNISNSCPRCSPPTPTPALHPLSQSLSQSYHSVPHMGSVTIASNAESHALLREKTDMFLLSVMSGHQLSTSRASASMQLRGGGDGMLSNLDEVAEANGLEDSGSPTEGRIARICSEMSLKDLLDSTTTTASSAFPSPAASAVPRVSPQNFAPTHESEQEWASQCGASLDTPVTTVLSPATVGATPDFQRSLGASGYLNWASLLSPSKVDGDDQLGEDQGDNTPDPVARLSLSDLGHEGIDGMSNHASISIEGMEAMGAMASIEGDTSALPVSPPSQRPSVHLSQLWHTLPAAPAEESLALFVATSSGAVSLNPSDAGVYTMATTASPPLHMAVHPAAEGPVIANPTATESETDAERGLEATGAASARLFDTLVWESHGNRGGASGTYSAAGADGGPAIGTMQSSHSNAPVSHLPSLRTPGRRPSGLFVLTHLCSPMSGSLTSTPRQHTPRTHTPRQSPMAVVAHAAGLLDVDIDDSNYTYPLAHAHTRDLTCGFDVSDAIDATNAIDATDTNAVPSCTHSFWSAPAVSIVTTEHQSASATDLPSARSVRSTRSGALSCRDATGQFQAWRHSRISTEIDPDAYAFKPASGRETTTTSSTKYRSRRALSHFPTTLDVHAVPQNALPPRSPPGTGPRARQWTPHHTNAAPSQGPPHHVSQLHSTHRAPASMGCAGPKYPGGAYPSLCPCILEPYAPLLTFLLYKDFSKEKARKEAQMRAWGLSGSLFKDAFASIRSTATDAKH